MSKRIKIWQFILPALAVLLFFPQFSVAGFEETFDNGSFSSRGWYDNTNPVLSSTEKMPGSIRSAEFRFRVGATTPVNGKSMRKKFSATDSVYVRYYVKYSSNWRGSNRSYHPHEFYILTNKDTDWTGPAYTNLTAYVEQHNLRPLLAIQDGRNIDLNNVGKSLIGITENRSIAGCNGSSNNGYEYVSCYSVGGGTYWNGTSWIAANASITPGTWHKVEAYFKLNSISNGVGIADGVMKYWLDDQLVMSKSDVMFRTSRHSDMKFNQFIIGPWIGDGSPVDQTFWVDNLKVANSRPDKEPGILRNPTNLRIITEK